MKAFLWVKSSTAWLTKAVDMSASYLVPVVTYMSSSLSSTQQMRKSIQIQFEPILRLGSSYATPALCILLGCWSPRKLGELL